MIARAWLLILLLVAPASGEPYLQWQGDAARSGDLADPGPEYIDLSYWLPLEGRPFFNAPPLIMDGMAYFLRVPNCEGNSCSVPTAVTDPVHDSAQIHVLRLDTGEMWQIASLEGTTGGWASDGELLFVAGPEAMIAFDLQGNIAWERPWAHVGDRGAYCPSIAVLDGQIIAGCNALSSPAERSMDGRADPGRGQLFVQIIRTDGAAIAHSSSQFRSPSESTTPTDSIGNALHVAATEDGIVLLSRSIRAQPALETALPQTTVTQPPSWFTLWGLDQDAEPQWRAVLRGESDYDPESIQNLGPFSTLATRALPFTPTAHIHDGIVYVRSERAMHMFELETGSNQPGTHNMGTPSSQHYEGRAIAFEDDLAIISGAQETIGFDLEARKVVWETPVPAEATWSGSSTMLVADGRAFGTMHDGRLLVLSTNGTQIAQQDIPGFPAGPTREQFAIGEGLAVFASDDHIQVFGVTDLSIGLEVVPSATHLPPGARLELDLSRTAPGAHSDDVKFRIDWGDGHVVKFAGGITSHRYQSNGTFLVTVHASNAAGQERTEQFSLVVGPKLLETPFLQSALVGIQSPALWAWIGALAFLILVVVGAMREVRNQREGRRESRPAAMTGATSGDQSELQLPGKDSRRAELLLALRESGKIDENQSETLAKYLDEVQMDRRMKAVHQDLGYLPVRLASLLQEMLSSGKFSDWKYDHFQATLAKESALTAAQRKKAQRVVRAWLRADS